MNDFYQEIYIHHIELSLTSDIRSNRTDLNTRNMALSVCLNSLLIWAAFSIVESENVIVSSIQRN